MQGLPGFAPKIGPIKFFQVRNVVKEAARGGNTVDWRPKQTIHGLETACPNCNERTIHGELADHKRVVSCAAEDAG